MLSSEAFDLVVVKFFVEGKDGDIAGYGFRNDEAVGGVAMMRGEGGGAAHGAPFDGEDVEAFPEEDSWEIGSLSGLEAEEAEGVFLCEFPEAGHGDQRATFGGFDLSGKLVRESGVVLEKEKEHSCVEELLYHLVKSSGGPEGSSRLGASGSSTGESNSGDMKKSWVWSPPREGVEVVGSRNSATT